MLFFTESLNHDVINLDEVRFLYVLQTTIMVIFIKHTESDTHSNTQVHYDTNQHALDDLHRIKTLMENIVK